MNVVSDYSTWEDVQRKSFAEVLRRIALLRCKFTRLTGRTSAEPDMPDAGGVFAETGAGASIDIIATAFGLSEVEQAVMLMALGVQIDLEMTKAASELSPSDNAARLTIGQVIQALSLPRDPATFELFSGVGTLFRYGFLHVDSGKSFLENSIQVDAATFDFLTTLIFEDPKTKFYLRPATDLGLRLEAHAEARENLTAALQNPVRTAVWLQASHGGFAEHLLATAARPQDAMIFDLGALHVDQETAFELGLRMSVYARLQDVQVGFEIPIAMSTQTRATVRVFMEAYDGQSVFWASETETGRSETASEAVQSAGGEVDLSDLSGDRPLVILDVPDPSFLDRKAMWEDALAGHESAPFVDMKASEPLRDIAGKLAEEFRLAPHVLEGAASQARRIESDDGALGIDVMQLQSAAGAATRSRLGGLAEFIEAKGDLSDVILAPRERDKLCRIRDHMQLRERVFRDWQLGDVVGSRGLGVAALLHGPSGTGKTFAAEKLAASLGLALYRVDLGQISSKWIGETEKNLRALFEAASGGGVMLLFDEADALFSKRSEATDGGGQHANATVGYLLQAMERHTGMMVLTTNRYDVIDRAFLRRLNYVVDFQAPNAAQRRLIWQQCLPATVPQEALDFDLLAGLQLAGGQIRIVSLHAAFHAAARGGGVAHQDVAYAALLEYEKHGRTPSERLFQVLEGPAT